MAHIIDWLAGRKNIKFKEGAGLSLVIQTIEEFASRTFSCPETTPKTSGIGKEEILELIQKELPSYYDYHAKIKKYIDRKGIPQAEIEIVGNIGISRRYNPLDRTFHIATETPKLQVR